MHSIISCQIPINKGSIKKAAEHSMVMSTQPSLNSDEAHCSHLIVLCKFRYDVAHSATPAIGLVVIGGAVHGGAAMDGAVVVPVRPVGGSVF